jgi:hypothetical protein
MDATRRVSAGLVTVLAGCLGILAAVPVAVLLAVALVLRTLALGVWGLLGLLHLLPGEASHGLAAPTLWREPPPGGRKAG